VSHKLIEQEQFQNTFQLKNVNNVDVSNISRGYIGKESENIVRILEPLLP